MSSQGYGGLTVLGGVCTLGFGRVTNQSGRGCAMASSQLEGTGTHFCLQNRASTKTSGGIRYPLRLPHAVLDSSVLQNGFGTFHKWLQYIYIRSCSAPPLFPSKACCTWRKPPRSVGSSQPAHGALLLGCTQGHYLVLSLDPSCQFLMPWQVCYLPCVAEEHLPVRGPCC